jgi:hypothetical protein
MTEIVALARVALGNIHTDKRWWRKIGIGGALMLTIFGYPFAAGLVVEHIDNSHKGFPIPLPPWFDWGTRYLLGLFSMLIDLVFFALPLMLIAMLTGCILLFVVIGGGPVGTGEPSTEALLVALGAQILAGLNGLFFFLSSVSPIGRLIYVVEGSIEDALSWRPLREAWKRGRRGLYFQARLASLVGYVPLLIVSGIFLALASRPFPGQLWVAGFMLWLWCSSLLYGHLVTGQVYIEAERRAGLRR